MSGPGQLCTRWEVSAGTVIWGISPLNARVKLAEVTRFSPMNGIDSPRIARLMSASPELLKLAQRVAALNPNVAEIGAGMLASLVEDARAAVAKASEVHE